MGSGPLLNGRADEAGQPMGRPSLKRVYSCSIPYQGSSSSAWSKMALAMVRVDSLIGVMSGRSISQRTRMLSPSRMGSLHMKAGLRKISESSPGACHHFVVESGTCTDNPALKGAMRGARRKHGHTGKREERST